MYDWLCRLRFTDVVETADIEIVLGEIEMLAIAGRAIELNAIHGVALAAGEGWIARAEILSQLGSRTNRRVEQVALRGRLVPGCGDFEAAVASARLLLQLCHGSIDLRLELRRPETS